MGREKKYWSTIEELNDNGQFEKKTNTEFQEKLPVEDFLSSEEVTEGDTGRRDFLKFLGFSVAAASLAACETPVIKSIPYVNKPENITPGVANYYASTYYDGNDYAQILVKTREGRPIFVKANKDAGSAANARIISSVLGLYDSSRLGGPKSKGEDTSWAHLDNELGKVINTGATVLLTNTIISPSTMEVIKKFKAATGAEHVTYDAVSYNGISKAHKATHGKSVIPSYDFSKAKTIVGIACDFLGTWMLDNIQSRDYSMRRNPAGEWMNKHHHFESIMSMTGTNADFRTRIKPSQEGLIAAALYAEINGGSGVELDEATMKAVKMAAADLKKDAGSSLVVSGSNDENVQILINEINSTLGNYGSTLNTNKASNLFQGNDASMSGLVSKMKSGKVKNLVVYGCNPSYDWHDAEGFNTGLSKVTTSISTNLFEDETGSRCTHLAPDHHYLESWNDLLLTNGKVDLVQPTISPLFDTRSAQDSLLAWAGESSNHYTVLRKKYNSSYSDADLLRDQYWNKALSKGYMSTNVSLGASQDIIENVDAMIDEVVASPSKPAMGTVMSAVKANASSASGWEVKFYQKVGIGTGAFATNPWMQELPDPVTKITWDNYITMAPSDMEEFGFEKEIAIKTESSVASINVNGKEVKLPVFACPGQASGTIGVAVGYGRGEGIETIGNSAYITAPGGEYEMDENGNRTPIGVNVFHLLSSKNGSPIYNAPVQITATDEEFYLASTQMHSTVMGRDSIVKETSLDEFKKFADNKVGTAPWNEMPALVVHKDVNNDGKIDALDKVSTDEFDLWKEHPVENVGHRWGMSIDLTSCNGCSACVVACHLENNVSVVGKDEVRRHRDMHWLRIDRFFSSDYPTLEETKENKDLGAIGAYADMENPAANPETVHMPMMCQHCNHAPCETVCPVAATTHSNEGLNMMAYNRCIGTRYCANNCPYKVRRFNWFNYTGYKKFRNFNPSQDSLTRMVLNPDVVVRTRGVMEKCSMCVQRIQKGKLDAKVEGIPVEDGSIVTACAEACPADAIRFGDLNDTKSIVRKKSKNVRSYRALEEIGTRSNIYYMTKVRNKA